MAKPKRSKWDVRDSIAWSEARTWVGRGKSGLGGRQDNAHTVSLEYGRTSTATLIASVLKLPHLT